MIRYKLRVFMYDIIGKEFCLKFIISVVMVRIVVMLRDIWVGVEFLLIKNESYEMKIINMVGM